LDYVEAHGFSRGNQGIKSEAALQAAEKLECSIIFERARLQPASDLPLVDTETFSAACLAAVPMYPQRLKAFCY
jgi:hypothetical protein